MTRELQGAPPTGALFQHGEAVWDEQVSAVSLYPNDDAGAPRSATVGQASATSRFDPFSLGYGGTLEEQPTEEAPTLSITIDFPFSGARRKVHVPWTEGMTVQQAWHAARTRSQFFRHIGVKQYAKFVGGRKVRLTTQLKLGDIVLLKRGGR